MKVPAVGLALAAGRGVVAWWPASSATPDRAHTEDFPFDADALTAGDDATLLPGLQAARLAVAPHAPARDARSHDARAHCVLHVALASPWTAPREVNLPPMRESEAARVLTRDAARYFPILRGEAAVAVRALQRGVWLAFDADGVVLDAIARAAHAAGFSAVRIVPAVAAWARAVGDARAGVFELEGETAVLGVRNGRLTAMRRCRAADHPASDAASGDALALAARHAPQAEEREFTSAAQRAAREGSVMRRVRQLGVIGMAAILAAVVLQAWGGAYRVARVERHRTALQPTVAPLRALRDSLLEVQDARTALALGRAQARWSERLAALAETLPGDASFTAFRGAGDSVVVEGMARDAQAAIERLMTARGVQRVLATMPASAADDREPFSAIVFFREGSMR